MPIYSGHAPSHIREEFCELACEREAWHLPRFRQLLGQLRSCSDVVPGDICECLDEPRGSSYAQVARSMKV